MLSASPRVLLVDLNNFARFPTLPVGLITAALRAAEIQVHVLSPLAVGMKGVPRPHRAKPWGYWDERLRWWSATTERGVVRSLRAQLRALTPQGGAGAGSSALVRSFRAALAARPDVILISSYLMYFDLVRTLAGDAEAAAIPVVVGGPAFQAAQTRAAWLNLPGVTALYAGECELEIAGLVKQLSRAVPVSARRGLSLQDGPDGGLAPPIEQLDALPYPDYSDFPWEAYPNRIVSMLTARGCGWGKCTFCSDVVSVNGRSFRSRSLANVLGELAHHRDRHAARLFCFSDLKLNSDLVVWRGLHASLREVVPGAKWTCAVHVGSRADEGLSRDDLRAARAAGLVRITTGLESGSQALLDTMRKGTRLERIGEFLISAREAGISTRVTVFTGYPGEDPVQVEQSAAFLTQHAEHIDRVHLSRLSIQAETPLDKMVRAGAPGSEELVVLGRNAPGGSVEHVNVATRDPAYRRSISQVLRIVQRINRRPLPEVAHELEGAM